jgi:hypothetical protein
MAEPHTDDMISVGWDVYDSDGERIGAVEEVTASYVRVEGETGTQLFIPVTAVEAAAGGEVRLDEPGTDAAAMGWDRPPSAAGADELLEDEAGTPVTDAGS